MKIISNCFSKIQKNVGLIILAVLLSFNATKVNAVELDEAVRSVPLNGAGKTVVLSLEEAKRGKRLFNAACSQCHIG